MVTTRERPESEDIDTSAPAAAYVNIPLAQWTYPKARHLFEREPDKVEARKEDRSGTERNRTGGWMGQIEEVNLKKKKGGRCEQLVPQRKQRETENTGPKINLCNRFGDICYRCS